MSEVPGLGLKDAYTLVTVQSAIEGARNEARQQGIRDAQLGIVEQPSSAQETGPTVDRELQHVDNLAKDGKTVEAVRAAMAHFAPKYGITPQF